jgi:hypothetical protein
VFINKATWEKPADAAACTVRGILHYNSSSERWEINYVQPGTIDAVDVYVVKKYKITSPENYRKEVEATGSCYPSDEKSPLGGHTVYYINVESLKEL